MNKRIIAFLSCSLLVVSLCAQTSLNNLYSEFSNEKKAENVNIGGLLLKMANPSFGKKSDSKISSVRVLSLEECTADVKQRFNEKALNFNDRAFELFLSENEPNEKVRIHFKIQDDMIREMVIFTLGDNPAMVHIKGKIKPSDIEKMNNGRK
jgi:translation elongation factor EF-G